MNVSPGPAGEHVAGSLSERAQSESAAVWILRHFALHVALSTTVEQPGETQYSAGQTLDQLHFSDKF